VSSPVAAAGEPVADTPLDASRGGPVGAQGLLFGALTVACWAGYNVAAKDGIDAGFRPVDLSALRFGVAGLVLAPMLLVFALRRRARLPGWGPTVALALVGGPLFSVLAVSGYQFAPLTHGILFAPAANFVAGTLLGVLWLGETVGRRHVVGGAIMLAGLALLSGVDAATLGPETLTGDFLFICTGSTWAVFTALMRRWRVDPVGGVLAQGTLACLLVPAVWFGIGGGTLFEMPPAQLGLQVVMQGVVGGLGASFAYFGAVGAMGAARASLLGPLVPGTALLIAAAVWMEPPRWVEVAGAATVSLGLIVATVGLRTIGRLIRRRRPDPPRG
jgi:drug/metabolite transporter (DMT)-like permease